VRQFIPLRSEMGCSRITGLIPIACPFPMMEACEIEGNRPR